VFSPREPAFKTTLAPFRLFGAFFAFSVPLATPPPHISAFFFTNVPSSPHTSSRMCICMFGHHPRRLCGWLGASGTQDLRALRLWLAELPAVARTAVELHGCCARVSLAAALLSQHIDGVARAGKVAQAPRAGRARAPWSCSPCWRPSSRTARFGDQLGLDDEANSRAARVTSVGDLPTSAASADSAVQLVPEKAISVWKACSARTTPFI